METRSLFRVVFSFVAGGKRMFWQSIREGDYSAVS